MQILAAPGVSQSFSHTSPEKITIPDWVFPLELGLKISRFVDAVCPKSDVEQESKKSNGNTNNVGKIQDEQGGY